MHFPINVHLAELAGILPALRELASGETITGAAHRLGMSQPALSRAIARCESELEVKLIERSGRGVILTTHGRALADAATEALSVFQPALEEVLAERDTRPIRLGTLRSIAGELAPLIADSNLKLNVNISEGASQDLLAELDKGTLDAAVLSPRPKEKRFQWTYLRNQELVLVVPYNHRLANHKTVTLTRVVDENFVAMDSRYTTRHFADELCAEAGITPTITVESDNSHTLRTYVAAGIGLCILPEVMASTDPNISTVRILRPSGFPATREIGLVKTNARPLPTQVRTALRSLIVRSLSTGHHPKSPPQ